MKEEYQVNLTCMNCEHVYVVGIEKGKTVADVITVMPCPNCGCKQLVKVRSI
jgi:DNA-directed RNA polymerase subunit RPC12/RpoP